MVTLWLFRCLQSDLEAIYSVSHNHINPTLTFSTEQVRIRN